MEWTRSETIGLALAKCAYCHGLGLRAARGEMVPCACVFRTIFRACYARFRKCVEQEKRFSRVALEYSPRGGRRITWGRKDEEYIADFYLVSRRHLSPEEWRIFKFHHLLGADYKLCSRQLKIDRGNFFHEVYRIEAKLGRIFRELRPYSLYPLDEYFQGRTENAWPGAGETGGGQGLKRWSLNRALRVPVRRAA